MERCGQSYGLHQVAYDTLLEVLGDTGYWWSRMNPAFPNLCLQRPEAWMTPIEKLRWLRATEMCQGFRINQSLETLARELFAATAYVCPHQCSDLGQFL